jgi:hypothetical protein
MAQAQPPLRQIRARYDDDTITLYQVHSDEIADPSPPSDSSPLQTDADDVDQALVPLDDVSQWLGRLVILSHFDAAIYRGHDEWLRIKIGASPA